jgi:hypothetical protein
MIIALIIVITMTIATTITAKLVDGALTFLDLYSGGS